MLDGGLDGTRWASNFALPYLALPYRLYNGRRLGAVVDCWTADWMGHDRASDFALLRLTLPCRTLLCFALLCLALPCLAL